MHHDGQSTVHLAQDLESLDLRCPLLEVNETYVPRVQQTAAPPPPKEALTPIAVLMKVRPACVHDTLAMCERMVLRIKSIGQRSLDTVYWQGFSTDVPRRADMAQHA